LPKPQCPAADLDFVRVGRWLLPKLRAGNLPAGIPE
jgi:hypothetical protein